MREIEKRKCKICGDEFEAYKEKSGRSHGSRIGVIRSGNAVTCSKKCSRKWAYDWGFREKRRLEMKNG